MERGNRVFPVTDNAQSVVDALQSKLKKLKVNIITKANVTDIIEQNGKIIGVEYIFQDRKQIIKADKVILATGGLSYSMTGSSRRWS